MCWMNADTAPRILKLGARWRWVVSFTLRPLFTRGKRPHYPIDRRVGGPQSRCESGGEEKKSEALPGKEPGRPARSLLTVSGSGDADAINKYYSNRPHLGVHFGESRGWIIVHQFAIRHKMYTGWMIGGSSSGRDWEFFSPPPRPDRFWDPPSLL
jgi:hypothetical protein